METPLFRRGVSFCGAGEGAPCADANVLRAAAHNAYARCMKRFLSVVLFCLCWVGAAHAEIYRWIDAEGNVVYSDQKPPPGVPAQKVELQPLPTVPAAPQPQPPMGRSSESGAPAQTQATIKIVSPQNEQAVRANNGDVTVSMQASPALAKGRLVDLYVDGASAYRGAKTSVVLRNLDRGQHRLYAELIGASGRTLYRSEPVTFYVLRHSVLFKKPSAPAAAQ